MVIAPSFLKKQAVKKFTYYDITLAILVFAIGLGIGYLLWGSSQAESIVSKRANDPSLFFTNPLLSCGLSENKEFEEYSILEKNINNAITKLDTKKENRVSVYYRDLTTGRWFGINDQAEYSPASLLKVPIMIAYLKKAESDPSVLSKKLFYDGHAAFSNSVEYYKSSDEIKPDNYYTVDELIASMIEHSDNSATSLLFNNINNNSLVEVMTDIGLKLPDAKATSVGTDDYMTVKSYSYLFRLLYNSTYLNREMSEKALTLLSYADFSQGIVSGLPKDVKSAQKFGERTIFDDAGKPVSRELHDCGIVYKGKSPYLLCVMTKGKDFNVLSSIIGSISSIIYKEAD